jgi:hypothetical protein
MDTECYILGNDVVDFRFEVGVERLVKLMELVGLWKLNSIQLLKKKSESFSKNRPELSILGFLRR